MSDHTHEDHTGHDTDQHHHHGGRFDWLLWGSISVVAVAWLSRATGVPVPGDVAAIGIFTHSVFELLNIMWWGILIGIFSVSILGIVPREIIISLLGSGRGIGGVARATLAGVLLDLCSHGILLVGTRLYDRGASLGQVMAFLIASPWNSFSLTIILIALIGIGWTAAFIVLSMAIAIFSGVIFNGLVARGTLPDNENRFELPPGFRFGAALRQLLNDADLSPHAFGSMFWEGLLYSRMILRWIFFGIVLAALVRSIVSPEIFATWFGASLAGLGLTVLVATLLEVCSEGSTPIAADLLTRARAPGNSFAFLMTGVATDYTEIMSLKEVTRSWKIALFLPLITVPQVLVIAWIMNLGFAN